MNPRLLAVACAVASAAHGAVIVRSDPTDMFKSVVDKRHGAVIGVRGLAVAPDGGAPVETLTYGTGALLGNGLAVTTLHAVALPSSQRKMMPLQHVQVLVPEKGPMPARVIAGVPDLDLAILELSAAGAALEGPPFSSAMPAAGDPLLAMGADDEAVIGIGVEVVAVNGDFLLLRAKRMLDSRFWGGPLFDAQGRLAGVELMSLGPSKAISVEAIRRLVEQRMRAQVDQN